MELSWLQSLLMGMISGLTDLLPVSSQAHQTLLLTFYGGETLSPLLSLAIHGATFFALLFLLWGQLGRIRRQLRLARLPKRRRTRTPEMTAIMDAKILRTAFWPILLGLLLYGSVSSLCGGLLWLAVFSLINAVILYLPRVLPTADKDSRLVTPGESMLMGLGTAAASLPGISSVGASYCMGVLHGVDRGYMIHLSLMMELIYLFGRIVMDALAVAGSGMSAPAGDTVLAMAFAAGSAAVGTVIGYRVVCGTAKRSGLSGFSYFSFGIAVFTFILYLMV